MKPVVLACISIFILNASASAQSAYTGTNLLPHCQEFAGLKSMPVDRADMLGVGVCAGIISTVVQFGPYLNQEHRFCPPKGASVTQAINIVVRILKERPDGLTLEFAPLVAAILQKEWSCQN